MGSSAGRFPLRRVVGQAVGMSKGPGRVQRGVLKVLEAGPLSSEEVALKVGASHESTRRALRRLTVLGQVRRVGFAGRGALMWCLAEDLPDVRAALPDAEMLGRVAALMGRRWAASWYRGQVGSL